MKLLLIALLLIFPPLAVAQITETVIISRVNAISVLQGGELKLESSPVAPLVALILPSDVLGRIRQGNGTDADRQVVLDAAVIALGYIPPMPICQIDDPHDLLRWIKPSPNTGFEICRVLR